MAPKPADLDMLLSAEVSSEEAPDSDIVSISDDSSIGETCEDMPRMPCLPGSSAGSASSTSAKGDWKMTSKFDFSCGAAMSLGQIDQLQTKPAYFLAPDEYTERFADWICGCTRECGATFRSDKSFLSGAYQNYTALKHLPGDVQDFCLHDHLGRCQVVDGQKRYNFLGTWVCKAALMRLLGLGMHRFRRVLLGAPDMRSLKSKLRTWDTHRATDAFSFLWGLYIAVAEHCPFNKKINAVAEPEAKDAKRELLAAIEVLYAENTMEADPLRLSVLSVPCVPKKALPPGSKREYHLLYLSSRMDNGDDGGEDGSNNAKGAAGYKTFCRVWSRRTCRCGCEWGECVSSK